MPSIDAAVIEQVQLTALFLIPSGPSLKILYVALKINLKLVYKLLAFDIVQYCRWKNMFLRNILLPSAGVEDCLYDQFVNSSISYGFTRKKVTTHISSWNEAWYSTMGTVNIKYKKAGNSASRYKQKCIRSLRDQKNNLATACVLFSHIVTLKAPVSKSTQSSNPKHGGSRFHRTPRHKRPQC
jgi:hypothetical protein